MSPITLLFIMIIMINSFILSHNLLLYINVCNLNSFLLHTVGRPNRQVLTYGLYMKGP